MPRYQIEAPDGRMVTVEGDRAPTQEDATKIFSGLPPKVASPAPVAAPKPAVPDPTALELLGASISANPTIPDFGTIKSLALNAGGAIGGGMLGGPPGAVLGGMAGNALDQATRSGQTGIRPGELLASGITSYMPGAASVGRGLMPLASEAVKAGGRGLLAKTAETAIDQSRLPTAGEAAMATALPAAGGALAARMQQTAPNAQAALAGAEARTSVKRGTVDAARDLGMVVPVSETNPSLVNNALEGMAGGTAVRQEASKINNAVVEDVARREIGVPRDTPLNMPTLEAVRQEAGQAYQAIGDLSNDAATIAALNTVNPAYANTVANAAQNLELLKQARAEANGYFKFADRTGDPATLKLARQYQQTADALEQEVENAATYSGRLELFDALKNARTRIAKTYNVERAMNLGDGAISAREFGKALDKGAPLSGDLETVAKFALAFPQAVKESTQTGTAGVSKLDFGLGSLAGLTTFGSTGNPVAGAVGAVAPALASYGARRAVLSQPYQNIVGGVPIGDVTVAPDALSRILAQTTQAGGQDRAKEKPLAKRK